MDQPCKRHVNKYNALAEWAVLLGSLSVLGLFSHRLGCQLKHMLFSGGFPRQTFEPSYLLGGPTCELQFNMPEEWAPEGILLSPPLISLLLNRAEQGKQVNRCDTHSLVQFTHPVFSDRIVLTASVSHLQPKQQQQNAPGMMRVPVFCVVVLAFICHSHGLEIQNPVYRFKR